MQVTKILVPTDFSESAANALRHAREYAARFDAELVLIHVVETLAVGYASDLFPVPMAEVVQEMAGQARAELAKLAEGLRAEGLRVRELVTQGKPSAEIVRVAEEESVGLIVVGTHGKGVLDHALFGSTTERVMRKAPCPVLSCRLPAHG
jgi:nucleotide-binding universal stress UspA family protein